MNTNPTIVMGILNITPDSFADGGRHFNFTDAIKRGESMIAEGAEIIDVGGESTRPGAERITEAEERNRVMPVIVQLKKLGAVISIDTMRAKIANEAIPPCAHLVEPESTRALVTKRTERLCARICKAVVKPATPEPITTTSALALQPGFAARNFILLPPLMLSEYSAWPYCRLNGCH